MTTNDPRVQLALQDEAVTRRAGKQLFVFVQAAWPILEPATPFLSNWHHRLLCEYLETVTTGDMTRLAINMPPRHGKSLIVSVFWPVWEWIRHPGQRWLFVSHSETLAWKHSGDRRRLLTSDWFRRRWPAIRLTRGQQGVGEFSNTKRGAMVALSMGGSVTGKGGGRLVIDDPHSPEQAESDTQREQAVTRFRQTLFTRLDDKRRGGIVVVMQRLNVRDLTAECLDLGFEHVALPALAPAETKIRFPQSGDVYVRPAEEPLWGEREDAAALADIQRTLGTYAFAAQYQQNPIPRTGGYFPREWWGWYDEMPDRFDDVFQSWDTSFKAGIGSDYVVGLVFGRIGKLLYVLDRYKAKASFLDTCRAIEAMVARWPKTVRVLVEEAANGAAIIDTLRQHVAGITPVKPEGGKEARAAAAQPQVEAKQVLLPRPRTQNGVLRPERAFVEDFVATCAAFPRGAHDDDVDALTQAVVWCTQNAYGVAAGVMLPRTPWFQSRFGIQRVRVAMFPHPWNHLGQARRESIPRRDQS